MRDQPLQQNNGGDVGYEEIRDQHGNLIGLNTRSYADIAAGHSRVVSYPNGHTVAFPDALNANEFADAVKNAWQQLSKAAKGAYATILGGASGPLSGASK